MGRSKCPITNQNPLLAIKWGIFVCCIQFPPDKSTNYTDVLHIGAISVDRKVYSIPMTERQFNENNTIMEEQTTIILDKEQLLILCSAIIIAGMASNYSTVSPTSTHLLVAQGLAQSLLDSILKK